VLTQQETGTTVPEVDIGTALSCDRTECVELSADGRVVSQLPITGSDAATIFLLVGFLIVLIGLGLSALGWVRR
jgi:LPXTG-motif cell wall-anchored protein